MDSKRYESWRFPIDKSKKNNSLMEINQAVQGKKVRYYPSFAACIAQQLKYQTWTYWAMLGGVMLMVLFLIGWLTRFDIEDQTSAITLCAVMVVLTGNVCLSSVGRLFSWHMAELEQTLYLNLKQMVCIHMLFAGIIDFIALGLIVVFCGNGQIIGTGAFLLYMLVPFLWSDILYLHMLTVLRGEMRGYRQLGVGLMCGILAVLPLFFEELYRPDKLLIWGLLSVAGIGILVLEIRRLLGKIEGGEDLCLN